MNYTAFRRADSEFKRLRDEYAQHGKAVA